MVHKAPGRHCRAGLSLVDVMGMFPDDDAAEAWIAGVRWLNGPRCPHCHSDNVQSGAAHKMPYRCRKCRKWFSVRTGTLMVDSKLGYQVWALAVVLAADPREAKGVVVSLRIPSAMSGLTPEERAQRLPAVVTDKSGSVSWNDGALVQDHAVYGATPTPPSPQP